MSNNHFAMRIKEAEREEALRYNEGKPKWSLVHFKSLEPLVRVLMYGANKYAPDNWKKGLAEKEILNSMQRHMAALIDGEFVDDESGEFHVGHIMANCMFYHYFFIQRRSGAFKEEVRKNLSGGDKSSE